MSSLKSRNMWIRIFQVLVSCWVLVYLIQLVDWNSVRNLVHTGTIYELWPGPFISMAGLIIASERWHLLLNFLKIVIKRSEALYMYICGTFYGVMLPGVLGGDAVRVGLCAVDRRGAMSHVLASVFIERGLGLWAVSLVGVIGLLLIDSVSREKFGWNVLLITPSIAVGSIFGFLILSAGLGFIGKRKTKFERVGKILSVLFKFHFQLRSLPFPLLLRTLLLSTVFQSAEILIFYYFGMRLHFDLPFSFYLLVVPIVYLSTVLPISMGGVGVREGVLVWLLSKVGIPTSESVLLAFLVYLNRLVVALVCGFIHLSYRRR